MNKVFEQEWTVYRQAEGRPGFRAFAGFSKEGKFDAPVTVGEIRVFADMPRPFVAAVVAEHGLLGWRIVPLSPFTVPASSREILLGERVYQLWNACTAARGFTARSWVVEKLGEDDLGDLLSALAAVKPGALSENGTARAYEREFMVAGGAFRPFALPVAAAKPVSHRAAWGVAASVVVLLGLSTFLLDGTKDPVRGDAYVCDVANVAEVDDITPPMCECEVECQLDESPVCDLEPARFAPKPCAAPVAEVSSPVKMKMRSMDGSRARRAVRGWEGNAVCGNRYLETVPPPVSGERYAEAVENAFKDPRVEPLSTFGLDVDTSSYALMRSSINELKRLPPKGSVRIEEYVNYFKYAYPAPKGDEPVAVDCELAACPWNAEHRLLRLGVQAKTVDAAKLPPCNLTFLIDVSGSMEWNRGLSLAKAGLKLLVERLRDEDHVAIVTYANGTEVRLPSVSGREKRAIGSVIDSLSAGGGTAGGAGIQLAYAEAQKNFDKKANNRVILITDGDFNIGVSSPDELEKLIAGKRETGVFLTVLGVGRGNFQDANMKKLANAGNGNYGYIDSMLEAKKMFVNEFGGTLMTVAKDVKVQIEFNPAEVAAYRLLGYENRILKAEDFNDDKKDAGEIGSGHTMTAFYEIVPAGSDDKTVSVDPLKYQKSEVVGKGELFTVKTRYKLPDAEKSVLRERAHTAAELTRKEASEDFRFASAVAEFALLLKDSKFKGEASFKQVLERARGAKGRDEEGYRAEFIRLVEAAELARPEPRPSPVGRDEDISVDVDM